MAVYAICGGSERREETGLYQEEMSCRVVIILVNIRFGHSVSSFKSCIVTCPFLLQDAAAETQRYSETPRDMLRNLRGTQGEACTKIVTMELFSKNLCSIVNLKVERVEDDSMSHERHR